DMRKQGARLMNRRILGVLRGKRQRMTNRSKPFVLALGLACVMLFGAGAPAQYVPKQSDRPEALSEDEPGFQTVFDGKTLNGWEGNPTYWRVENGTVVGENQPATVVKSNTFIIWRGGKARAFELELGHRIPESGNIGLKL